MLTCHSCIRRCLQTIVGDSALVSTLPPARFFSNPHQPTSKRRFNTTVNRQPYPARFTTLEKGSAKPSNIFAEREGQISTSENRQKWLESRGQTPTHKQRQKEADDPLVRRQLKHLKDPLKLAEHVRTTLREDDFQSALAIVRAASKDTQCVVSWNHLIDWQLSKHKMKDAIKTYNEMKKRAQTPDAYTYTIIFRGCADHPLPTQALANVIAIYTSMLAAKAPVKPNTIHMNAILKMCARAGDVEAMLAIADNMPTKGIRAANMVTYSIVLNAIRVNAFTSLRGDLTPVQRRRIREDANKQARRIWSGVARRWRQGDFVIDESLVCTMGRILLLGVEQDIDDVLSLVEQSMNIPRQTPSLSSQNGRGASRSSPAIQEELRLTTALTQDEVGLEESNPFDLVEKTTGLYAKPGQNTLSLLMEALLDLRLSGPAFKYWEIFTNQLSVDADAHNYHAYLRVLRVARASTETVKLLLQMPPSYMEVKTFRIAMSTCRRDINNQHAFTNAGKILDVMQTTCETPDPSVVTEYLNIAFSVSSNSKKSTLNPDANLDKGKQIMRALERLNPSYLNLRSLMAYGDPSKPPVTSAEKQALTTSVLELSRSLVKAHDILLNNQMVSQEKRDELVAQRSKLAAFITRWHHKRNGNYQLRSAKEVAVPDSRNQMTTVQKTGSKTNAALRNEAARQNADEADGGEKGAKAQHLGGIQGELAEKFAERERLAAEKTLSWTTPPPQTLQSSQNV